MSTTEFTPAELVQLRREYTPTTIPPCHLCGGPMVQTGPNYDGLFSHACRTAVEEHNTGWLIHYNASKTTYQTNPRGNPQVIRLIDALESAQRRLAEREATR